MNTTYYKVTGDGTANWYNYDTGKYDAPEGETILELNYENIREMGYSILFSANLFHDGGSPDVTFAGSTGVSFDESTLVLFSSGMSNGAIVQTINVKNKPYYFQLRENEELATIDLIAFALLTSAQELTKRSTGTRNPIFERWVGEGDETNPF